MRVERFRASNMKEALKQVKDKLGPEAVILNTRSVSNTSNYGIGTSEIIEVIAAVDRTAPGSKLWTPESLLGETAQRADYKEPVKMLKSAVAKLSNAKAKKFNSLAKSKKSGNGRSDSKISQEPDNSRPTDWDALMAYSVQNKKEDTHSKVREMPQSQNGQSTEDFSRVFEAELASVESDKRIWLESEKRLAGLKKEMNELKEMLLQQELIEMKQRVQELQLTKKEEQVKEQVQEQEKETEEKKSLLYVRMRERLVERGVAEAIAAEITSKVQTRIEAEKIILNDRAGKDRMRDILCEEIANLVPTLDTNSVKRTRPKVLAFVGPPGSGKTNACAKVAVKNAYLFGKNVSLVLVNMSTNGVAQHLSSVASITQLPLAVVKTANELKATISAHQDKDLILIDFAVNHSSEENNLPQLSRLIKAAAPHEIHLVLPANLKTSDALAAAKTFRCTNFDRVVFSRIDETSTVGSLIEVIKEIGKPLSYFSVGPVVPDDIEPASSIKLANMILSG